MVRSSSLSSTHVLNSLNLNKIMNKKKSKEDVLDKDIIMNTIKTKKNLDLKKEKMAQ